MCRMKNTVTIVHPWVIRAVERRDMEELGQLTTITYGKMWKRAGSAAYYEWKLFQDEAPAAPGFVAVAKDQVVGSLLSCRKRFRMGDQVFWAMERGDAMTHPEYRRQGMWQELMSKLTTEGDDQGAYPVMGFPAPEPFLGHKNKFSQRAFLNIWRMVLPLNSAAFTAQMGLHALPSKLLFWSYHVTRSIWQVFQPSRERIRVEKVDNFEEWADQLWEEESFRQEVGVVKDATY
jgi:GNAT superfamily N-acetyltransferase